MARPDRRPLPERHRPSSLSSVLGNEAAVSALNRWADAWQSAGAGTPRFRAALLVGPPGIGKTTAALALAADRGWSVVEMNASEARNQGAIDAVAGRAAITNTLGVSETYRSTRDGGRSLILLDEADCLSGRASEESTRRRAPVTLREFLRSRYGSVDTLAEAWGLGRAGAPVAFESWESVPSSAGRAAWTRLPAAQRDLADWREGERPRDTSDRGGLGAIARIVRESRQPVILTVNDVQRLTRYSPVFSRGVARIEFEPLPRTELRSLLRRVAVAEGFAVPGPILDRILERSAGDVRAALNDLEAVSVVGAGAQLDALWGGRDRSTEIEEFVHEAFTHPHLYRSTEVSNRVDEPPEVLLPWFEEALARTPLSPERRWAAIRRLATADGFVRRGTRQRVFSLWSYATEVLSGGVPGATGPVPEREFGLAFPAFLGSMGRTKEIRAIRTELLAKLRLAHHLSRRKAAENILPIYERLLRPDPRTGEADLRRRRALVRPLGLSPGELGLLLGVGADDPRVAELIEATDDTAVIAKDLPPPVAESGASAPVQKKVQRRLGEY